MLRKAASIVCMVTLAVLMAAVPAFSQTEKTDGLDKAKSKAEQMQMIDEYLKKSHDEAARIRGVRLVRAAKTKDIMPLSADAAKTFYNFDRLERKHIPFEVRYAAIDYKMAQENRYAINGINYRIVIFTNENGQWQVGDVSLVPVDVIVEQNLGFKTKDEREMAELYKERAKGIYLNRQKQVIDKANNATAEDLSKEQHGQPPENFTPGKWSQFVPDRISKYYLRPMTIKVLMTTPENKAAYGCENDCVQELNFLDYIQTAFALTWPKDAPPEALKAGALAVKMYSWFSIVVDPTAHRLNADVIDTDPSQVFKANYVPQTAEEKASLDRMRRVFYADDVAGIGFWDGMSHNLFLPQTTDQLSLEQATGVLSRTGAVELAKQGKDAAEILQHYFEGSDRMEEAVSPLAFFRYAPRK